MIKYKHWHTYLLLALLVLALQSCLGIGGNDQFQTKVTTKNGTQVGISSQAMFKGNIYFTLDHNLYVLSGSGTPHQLTQNMDVQDPAVSPDGKLVAFIARYKDYSDLAYMPSSGGQPTILEHGDGQYLPNPGFPPRSTHRWFAQPSWASDSQHLLFLSDLQKATWNIGVDAFLLDLQVFSIAINDPATIQDIAYATYGDGGLRDPDYRPGHPDQIIYTDYRYDQTQTKQLIQLYMEDPNAIANSPHKYHPGVASIEFDPSVAITPENTDIANMEPTFSPDGNTILYVRRDDATHMSLYTMPAPEAITQDPNNPAAQQKAQLSYNQSSLILTQQYVSQPVWSPDGKRIAYVSFADNTFNLWLATLTRDPKTGAYSLQKDSQVQLTDAQGHLDAESRPCWSA